jgi:hypothetical protein
MYIPFGFLLSKKMIDIRKIARMKQGETAFTTKRNQTSYPSYNKVKDFKTDMRLLLDYKQTEVDLCSGEVASNAKDSDKLAYDKSKCLREAREILDHHIQTGMGEDAIGWTLQIAGLEAHIMSVHLYREGLYVTVSQNKLGLPQSVGEIHFFLDSLQALFYLIVRT